MGNSALIVDQLGPVESSEHLRDYYDEFRNRLLLDFALGNPRTELAIRHALQWIPMGAVRVLDIGCGIGWSTWEIKRHLPRAEVLGIDISPSLISAATALFEDSGVGFQVQDILQTCRDTESAFDAIVMLDVYEHIPQAQRCQLHVSLRQMLRQGGALVLAFPSPSHQAYLRQHYPERLQPVDEDVTTGDVYRLANDIDGQVVSLQAVSIWQNDDYVHAAIQRTGTGTVGLGNVRRPTWRLDLTCRRERQSRLKRRLGIRVVGEGIIRQDTNHPVVCVVSPLKGAYSETFIRAHIERLPGKVVTLYGGGYPFEDGESGTLIPSGSTAFRLQRALLRRTLRVGVDDFHAHLLANYLKDNRVDVVLAEYGPTGVAVLPACRRAGVPLAVHFHGYDAYHREILDRCRASYLEMFRYATAVVAVSRHMVRRLVELGAPAEKVHYNPCGVDTDLFAGADPADSVPLFVFVGRFVDKKGPHLTLLAFNIVAECVPEASLWMIGDGPLLESCKHLCRGLGLESRVCFLGAQPHYEVAATMRRARALVQHSITPSSGDSEGTPVAVLEAGAAGLPVVATRHGGIVDVVIEGHTGFLVDEGDIRSMAHHMIRLATGPDEAAKMGKAARERILTHFGMDASIGRLWEVMHGGQA